jgi:3-phenylpropionate/trans-cinnamate dioxygenase ferredoxin component
VTFERACSLDELRAGEALGVTLGDQDVAIAREDDEVFVVEDTCSHSYVPLSEGDVEGCTVECWLHGSRFDLRTGKPTGLPATEPVATFPVEVRGTDVYVDVTTTLNGVTPQGSNRAPAHEPHGRNEGT